MPSDNIPCAVCGREFEDLDLGWWKLDGSMVRVCVGCERAFADQHQHAVLMSVCDLCEKLYLSSDTTDQYFRLACPECVEVRDAD